MVLKISYTFTKSVPLISLILCFLRAATSNPHLVQAKEVTYKEDPEFYILDETPTILLNVTLSSKARLLGCHHKKIRKGIRCHVAGHNICNGVKADKGASLLYCCKKHCRNILGDMNNCGQCGHKCRFGQRCCGGICTYVGFNPNHCGKCNKKCKPGVRCENGLCGYS